MHVARHDIPTKIDAPGAAARQLPNFGAASGELAAEYFSLGAGTDLAPFLQGLTNDACHSTHWGSMISGDVVVSYDDDSTETCTGGDDFYWQPGHSVRVEIDAEVILFSPQADHAPVLDHTREKMGV
jgi:hypothetical protein